MRFRERHGERGKLIKGCQSQLPAKGIANNLIPDFCKSWAFYPENAEHDLRKNALRISIVKAELGLRGPKGCDLLIIR